MMWVPEATVARVAWFSPVGFLSLLQDMCKISLMYCKLIKERAEALSLSEQNEGEAANKVGVGTCPTPGQILEGQDLALVYGQRGS